VKTLVWVAPLVLLLDCAQVGPNNSRHVRDMGGVDLAGASTGNCGSAHQICCTGNLCESGLTCNRDGACCGRALSSCKTANDCCAGFGCANSRCCTPAGGNCNNNNDCCPGMTCSGGTCQKSNGGTGGCGTSGKPCGAGGCCVAGTVCVGGSCKPCGTGGQPCCDANQCTGALVCNSGVCGDNCGAQGRPCCAGSKQCLGTLTCNNGSCGAATPSGSNGQPCLPGGGCNTPDLLCLNLTCQPQPACTAVGAPCCAGSTCMNGLTCSPSARCIAPTTAPTCGDLQASCTTMSSCCPPLSCVSTETASGTVAKSCCVGEGGACPNGDLDCCGYLTCSPSQLCVTQPTDGPCLSNSDCLSRNCDPSAHLCNATPMTGGTLAGLPLGASCDLDEHQECAGTALCLKLASTMAPACCDAADDLCTTSKDCCGYMTCDPTTLTCKGQPAGTSCFDSTECAGVDLCSDMNKCVVPDSAGSSTTTTGSNTVPIGGACGNAGDCAFTDAVDPIGCPNGSCCYLTIGHSCNGAAECCGTWDCASNTSNASDPKVCCKKSGDACSASLTGPSQCCGSSLCIFGSCS
jgi:hypothetical protein